MRSEVSVGNTTRCRYLILPQRDERDSLGLNTRENLQQMDSELRLGLGVQSEKAYIINALCVYYSKIGKKYLLCSNTLCQSRAVSNPRIPVYLATAVLFLRRSKKATME